MAIIRKQDGSEIHIDVSRSWIELRLKCHENINDILMTGNCEIIEATTNERMWLEQAYRFRSTPENQDLLKEG